MCKQKKAQTQSYICKVRGNRHQITHTDENDSEAYKLAFRWLSKA